MKNAMSYHHHAEHVCKILIYVLRVVANGLLIGIGYVKDDIEEYSQYHRVYSPDACFGSDHIYEVAYHYDDQKVNEEIQVYPDQVEINQSVEGIQVLQGFPECNKAHNGEGEAVYQKMVQFPAFKLLKEEDRN